MDCVPISERAITGISGMPVIIAQIRAGLGLPSVKGWPPDGDSHLLCYDFLSKKTLEDLP